jgi:hypothetical protein
MPAGSMIAGPPQPGYRRDVSHLSPPFSVWQTLMLLEKLNPAMPPTPTMSGVSPYVYRQAVSHLLTIVTVCHTLMSME